MRVFFSAGEASGDAYGAALLKALPTGVEAEALGGPRLRAAGAAIIADSSRWGAIGIVPAVGVFFRALRGALLAKRRLGEGKPGVFVPIDFGFVNIKLARIAKARGWKVLYFIPPGSWRRDSQGADLPAVTDLIVTPFPWSADILRSMGANAHWFGHPIKSLARGRRLPDDERKGVAVLPGSRKQELDHNLPVVARAVEGLGPVEFALAPNISMDLFAERWRLLSGRDADVFTPSDVPGVLGRARAAIVCSGTATLEAAVARCPMVVIYRLSKLTSVEARLLGLHRKLRFVSLPNILLEREAVPELLQEAASGGNIRAWLDRLTPDGIERSAQLSAFEELDKIMGPNDCIDRTASLIVELAQSV